nr:proline, glutamate and leucine rich protein 1 [Molossus molossus]
MDLAVAVLRDLLRYAAQLPTLFRDISMNHLPGLLTSLLGLRPECELSALEGMKACMTYFPRACGSLKSHKQTPVGLSPAFGARVSGKV